MAEDWSPARRADAMSRWRAGEWAARRIASPDWRHDYEVAIDAMLATLQGCAGMADLLESDRHDRHATWARQLCTLPGGRLLSEPIVEDAAYWRRLQQLLAAQRDGR
jgi:hypothetical protein